MVNTSIPQYLLFRVVRTELVTRVRFSWAKESYLGCWTKILWHGIMVYSVRVGSLYVLMVRMTEEDVEIRGLVGFVPPGGPVKMVTMVMTVIMTVFVATAENMEIPLLGQDGTNRLGTFNTSCYFPNI